MSWRQKLDSPFWKQGVPFMLMLTVSTYLLTPIISKNQERAHSKSKIRNRDPDDEIGVPKLYQPSGITVKSLDPEQQLYKTVLLDSAIEKRRAAANPKSKITKKRADPFADMEAELKMMEKIWKLDFVNVPVPKPRGSQNAVTPKKTPSDSV